MPTFSASDLDEFIRETDRLGGPNTPATKAYWATFSYAPTAVVDQGLDPYSDEYFAQMCALYRELSGRDINADENEMSDFPFEKHREAANPYAAKDPSNFAFHFLRLGEAIQRAKLPENPAILDMGAGWGLSSEFLATLGARVTAMDINPQFVDLINRRAQRHGMPVSAVRGRFDDFTPADRYDAVLFYECLHHAMRPWDLVARARDWLNDGGKIIFAGEPVNAMWWRHWGLRLDPLSVYCIRKFGWFESGWSEPFIVSCMRRAGMFVDFHVSATKDVGAVCVATKFAPNATLKADELRGFAAFDGWEHSERYNQALAESTIRFRPPFGATSVVFNLVNFRQKDLALKVFANGSKVHAAPLAPGPSALRLPAPDADMTYRFVSETWTPDREIKNGDRRSISFCVEGASFPS